MRNKKVKSMFESKVIARLVDNVAPHDWLCMQPRRRQDRIALP